MKRYVIFSRAETNANPDLGPAFWSNDEGWTNLRSALVLNEEEIAVYTLPFSGDDYPYTEAEYVELPKEKDDN